MMFCNFYILQGNYSGFDKNEPTSESHGKARVVTQLKSSFNFKRYVQFSLKGKHINEKTILIWRLLG